MTRRSRGREVALQLLFQRDLNTVAVPRRAIERFVRDRLRDAETEAFTLALYDGVVRHHPDIDRALSATAENWRLSRMTPSDRNVLRLGLYELAFDPQPSPSAVILNEAIELARRFGTADSPAFVNGVLDKLAKTRPGSADRPDGAGGGGSDRPPAGSGPPPSP